MNVQAGVRRAGQLISEQDPSRLAAIAFLLGSGLAIWYWEPELFWVLALAPLMVGAAFPLARFQTATSWIDGLGSRFESAERDDAGFFFKYIASPFLSLSRRIWTATDGLADKHLQAGIRVCCWIYLAAITLGILAVLAYLVVIIVAVILAIVVGILMFVWFIKYMLDGGQRRVRYRTKYTTDFFGSRREEHYDDSGRRVGESRLGTTLLGNPKTEHFDTEGQEIGESRPSETLLGAPRTEHFDKEGKKRGESRPSQDLMGEPKVEHFDESGKKVGESRERSTLSGERVTEHKFDEDPLEESEGSEE